MSQIEFRMPIKNPTEAIIEEFRHKMQTLSQLAISQLRHAKENQSRDLKDLASQFMDVTQGNRGDQNVYQRAISTNTIVDLAHKIVSLKASDHADMLAEIMFISVFSAFDAYLNRLLRNFYTNNTHLLRNFESRQIAVNELVSRSKEDILESLIDSEIESLLRESYIKQFEKLKDHFGVSTLNKFKNWPRFVECSQRRNLVTHCDGIVSKQYISNCASAGVTPEKGVIIGKKLPISIDYLLESIEIVLEVGLKLGQVLWRSCSADELSAADTHLGNLIFELLKVEQWSLALRMGELGLDLAKLGNHNTRDDRAVKVILINHAQAAKWSGDNATAMKILKAIDWSGSAHEFRIAVACLRSDWDTAASLMKQVGSNSEFLPIHGYISWPVFREFRTNPKFLDAFRSIFGVEFAAEVKKATPTPQQLTEISDYASGSNPEVDTYD